MSINRADALLAELEATLRIRANEDALRDAELDLMLLPDRTEDEQ